ncbi:uncharacterized protein LOC113514801 [Galleria mellonella]|uniref:Uncharacterized protein LOC113514801 n=1 Tax=Galleria mellonella TaxID=7137 RepID=A0ABM3N713_GALME|nr:uncharacterized protein LOC113514801 [Galleria mellonella]
MIYSLSTIRDAPSTSLSKDAPCKATPSTRPRTATTTVEPRKDALRDAPIKAASKEASSKGKPVVLTEAVTEGLSSKAASEAETGYPTMDMSSLKDAIQSPSNSTWTTITKPMSASKKRRLKAKAKAAAQRALAADAARQIAGPSSRPVETKPVGEVTMGGTTALASVGASAAPSIGIRKRSMKPRGRKKSGNNQQKPESRAQKRARPEDSVTPTGVGKKPKTNKPRTVRGTAASYAEAAATFIANELCVAVMMEPFSDMTQEQAEGIRKEIEDKLRDELMAEPDASLETEPNDIRFRGRAHFADGVLKTWCEDAFTLAWLNRTVQNMASPIANSKLVVRPQSAIPKKVPCLLFVPGHTGDSVALRKLLARQNRNLNINSWTLTHERARSDPPGTCLFFRVPETDVNLLKAQDRRLYYLMGNIYIRFLDKDASPEPNTNPTQQPEEARALTQCVTPKATLSTKEAATVSGHAEPPIAMEVQNLPSPRSISDEECFPEGGGESETSDGVLYSSPLRED